jgi:dimethylargininase
MDVAIVRKPTESLARCLLTHIERSSIDLARALEQHAAYTACLRELGCEIVELAPLPACPDAVFIEDTAVVLDDVAVIACPGAPSRRAECASVARELAKHRATVALAEPAASDALPSLDRTATLGGLVPAGGHAPLGGPATLDGGDVMAVDHTLYVGQSKRTNHAGLKALAHLVLEHGYRVKAVDVRGALHLKSACTHLGRGVLLVNRDWIAPERLAPLELVDVDPREPFAANSTRVGRRVVMSSAYPRTAERVERAGFDVYQVDLSEFHKAEAGATCLSLIFPAHSTVPTLT